MTRYAAGLSVMYLDSKILARSEVIFFHIEEAGNRK